MPDVRGIRIFVIDDQPVVCEGIKTILTGSPGLKVVGSSSDGNDAIEQCALTKPDVAFVDLSLSGLAANAVTRELAKKDIRVIALVDTPDAVAMHSIIDVGAAGLVLKSDPVETFAKAVHDVMADRMFQSESLKRVLALGNPGSPTIDAAVRPLTPRELEVLKMFADGNTTSEIATRLALSVKTVETHRKNVMDKLQTRSIAQLTKIAIQCGISSLNS